MIKINTFIRQGKVRLKIDDVLVLKPNALEDKKFPKRGKLRIAADHFNSPCTVENSLEWTTASLHKGALAKYRRCEFTKAGAQAFFSYIVRRLLRDDLLLVNPPEDK